MDRNDEEFNIDIQENNNNDSVSYDRPLADVNRPRRRPEHQQGQDGRTVRRRPRPQGERRVQHSSEKRPRPRYDDRYDGRRRSRPAKNGSKKKKKWSKKKKGFIIAGIIIAFLLIILGILLAIVFHYINLIDFKKDSDYEIYDSIPSDDNLIYPSSPEEQIKSQEDKMRENLEKNAKEIISDDNVLNILLIGTDSRGENDRGRSDSMILVSINKKTEKVVMTSFLRDIWVTIPEDIGNQRLNAAYAYGGPPLLAKTIQNNFGIRIDKYATINFESFKDTIDTIGGVDIRVTDEEVPHINSGAPNSEKLKQGGKYTLNGEQALAYSRIRYIGTDFGRTQRQRTVMDEIFRKTKGMSLSELSEFLEKILPNVSTNFEKSEVLWLLLKASDYLSYPRKDQSIPNLGSYQNLVIDGMMVLGIDFEKYNKELKESIYG